VNGRSRCFNRVLKKAKPIREAGMLMVETHPVCSPKYIFEKQMTRPTPRPTSIPRTVKFCPSLAWLAMNLRALLRRRRSSSVPSEASSRREVEGGVDMDW
jgi:hypothetical protein